METKSARILGGCIIVAALIVAWALRSLPLHDSAAVGRYQFGSTSGVNCFVLDTQTGQLWQKFVAKDSGPSQWSEEPSPWMKATDQ